MQDILEKVLRNFKEFFTGLDATKKMAFVAVSFLIIAAMASMVIWASKTRYDVLYTDLNKDDAHKIAIILEEKKIPYQRSEENERII